MAHQFPLSKATTPQLQNLTQSLWNWDVCSDCLAGQSCETDECPWPRSTLLSRFFEFYNDITTSYQCDVKHGQQPSLKSHDDLLLIIKEIKHNPELKREELLTKLFLERHDRSDQERAVNLAVRVLMMVNCSDSRQSSALLEYGTHQTSWRSGVTFSQFITDSFPKTNHPSIEDIKENLRATKLGKRAALRFQQTDDLRNHLKLDRKSAVVEIFHHTAFLKEQLRLTKDGPQNLSTTDSIKLGVFPRALVLEALDSIQQILFPLTHPKSKSFLRSLTSSSNCNFDPDILRFDSTSIRNPDEKAVSYHYFGSRLAELYEEMENPTPRGLEKWFERKSGARYVMMATFIGVVIAIFLGMASLALGGYQAWVGYQQWQHPIHN